MELKIVMNDHCKLLAKRSYFLDIFIYMLDDRSEQKVTTLDKDLARNISAKYGSNPSSGS
jgi:hypothetical protein